MLPVHGTVQYDNGQPVTGELATIVFQPDAGSTNVPSQPASGTIETDGSFTLMSIQPGDGAMPGDYRVVLKVWSDYRAQTLAIPKEYTEEATTPLRASVGADRVEFTFTVDR